MIRTYTRAAAAVAATFAAASCSFSTGGLDYDKLETAITDELNKSYADFGQTVSAVECPEVDDPKPGSKLECTADVADAQVRVDVTVKDEDYNVDFETRDILFELERTNQVLSDLASQELGTGVTITCDREPFFVVPSGETFECNAVDTEGATGIAVVSVGEDGTVTITEIK